LRWQTINLPEIWEEKCMLSKDELQEQEERIRARVMALPDSRRAAYFTLLEKKLKDPDTYATLNFIFIAGLHHFYLGRWARGLLNILVFWVGIALLFTGFFTLGIITILAITAVEFYELFRSQSIVQDYNNRLMETLYREVNQS
jgi:TM2 domain-containing membrane protein YozV